MTLRDFNYWLRGYLDVMDGAPLSGDQVAKIRKKMGEVVLSDYPYAWPYGFARNNTYTDNGTLYSNGPTAQTDATWQLLNQQIGPTR